jgi:DNA-directed RNA polymerase subunit RPC12/RpoP
MLYFLTCDQCGAEISVTPIETQQYRAKTCNKCGAELVFANSELQEGRMLVVFRCHNQQCTALEIPQELPITRTALREMSQPGSEGKFMCRTCGQLIQLTDQERENNLRMLAEEAA